MTGNDVILKLLGTHRPIGLGCVQRSSCIERVLNLQVIGKAGKDFQLHKKKKRSVKYGARKCK